VGQASIPERISWAIEIMNVRPDDQLLEIGPGPGVAVAAISDRLGDGTITAIDRSEKAVTAARQRNAAGIAAGKVFLQNASLETATFPAASFGKIFAINVNLFWVKDPALELALIKPLLGPGGTLYLFYEPPSSAQVDELARVVANALRSNGFTVSIQATTRAERSLLCLAGRPRGR
jgi:ubiquinone/menaquinone biosynthesis C-methylase UbiE